MARSKAAATRNGNANGSAGSEGPIRGAELRPVRVVRRQLVSPSGRVVVVDVPVYPPFRLETPEERERRTGSG